MYDRTMSGAGYDIFRDYRLEIGERLKQAPMGYFSEQNLGTIQAMLCLLYTSLLRRSPLGATIRIMDKKRILSAW